MEELTKQDLKTIVSALNSRIAYAKRQLMYVRSLKNQPSTSADIRKEQVVYWKQVIKSCLEVKMKLEGE